MNTGSINVVVKENYTLRTLIRDSYGTYHAIIYRERTDDYVFCWNYDIGDGTWGQGHYCSTFFKAWNEMCASTRHDNRLHILSCINVKVH